MFLLDWIIGWISLAAWSAPVVYKPMTECEKCHEVEFRVYAGSAHHLEHTSCHDCHGGNPAAVKESDAHLQKDGFMADFEDHVVHCGRCHASIEEPYRRGPHFDHFDENVFDLLSCTTCHRFHDVEEVSEVWFRTNCERCHKDEPDRMARGLGFFQLARSSRVRIAALESGEKWLRGRGFACDSERNQRKLMKDLLATVGPVSHALEERARETIDGQMAELAEKAMEEIEAKEKAYQRALWSLVPCWLFFAALAVFLLGKLARSFPGNRAGLGNDPP